MHLVWVSYSVASPSAVCECSAFVIEVWLQASLGKCIVSLLNTVLGLVLAGYGLCKVLACNRNVCLLSSSFG